ncbi:MAG: DUF4394 domain-containing protein [Burkholderiales bacterium]|nr:DUF4394 domain-containing protein [Opitutaceae bacterium]
MQSRLHTLGLAAILGLASAPAAQAFEFWAVNIDNQLVRYDSSAPGTALGLSTEITGLRLSDGVTADPSGQITDLTFVGSTLYGLDGNANLYTLNRANGAATFVSGNFSPAGFDLGMAYDSFTGGLRIVTDDGENFSATLDGVFTAGPSVSVISGFGDANQGASLAFSGLALDIDFGTGYAFDANLDTLFLTNDANFEIFSTIGALGDNFTAMASFDFVDGATLLGALSTDGFNSGLYTVNTTTGQATLVGGFGTGIQALAIDPSVIPEPSAFAALAGLAGLGLAALRRRRAA